VDDESVGGGLERLDNENEVPTLRCNQCPAAGAAGGAAAVGAILPPSPPPSLDSDRVQPPFPPLRTSICRRQSIALHSMQTTLLAGLPPAGPFQTFFK